MSLAEELTQVVHGEVDATPETLEQYSRDASLFVVRPRVVVHANGVSDVCALVQYINQKEESEGIPLSLTARSAGTDMSGGPLNNSIIVDMVRHCNQLLELGDGYAVVEPGMYFRDFDRETEKKHLELPSYTASREINTVGGMVANNSGGEKNLKYGKTARYVQVLDVVLADGKVHTLQNLSGDALRTKCAENSYEGDIYRAVTKLVKIHKKLIQSAKPHVEKNSSGYALWEIGDGDTSLDLARLMVGAQGTLGIITKIRFSLIRPKPYSAMTVIFLQNLSELGNLVPEILKHAPDSFESYDDHTFALGIRYFPEFAASMKSNLFSLTFAFLPEIWMTLVKGLPKLVLLVEFRSHIQEEALTKAEALATELKETRPGSNVRVAPTERASRKYWVIRRESFNLLRKKIRGQRTIPFIDDFVVPPQVLSEFLPKLENILSGYDLIYTIAGHMGDGNFHVIPLADPTREDLTKIIDEISHRVYDLVLSYQGSISGEHNDGMIRTPYIEKMFGKDMYALFSEIKKIFDPKNIFNPGKKTGGTFSDAVAHFDLPSAQ